MLLEQDAMLNEATWTDVEPVLDDMLTDPIVVAVMHRDGLTESHVRDVLDRVLRPATPPRYGPGSLPATVPASSF
ncbi:MAG: hypothetical protein HN768_12990 [Rhodospirillaceae bacterium]|nr:hypothetical protein [Rhodospirillaceae bacterium]